MLAGACLGLRLWVEQRRAVGADQLRRERPDHLRVAGLPERRLPTPEVHEEKLHRLGIDLRPGPRCLPAEGNVRSDVVDRLLEAPAVRRLVAPQVHPYVAPRLGQPGKRFDVEAAVVQ